MTRAEISRRLRIVWLLYGLTLLASTLGIYMFGPWAIAAAFVPLVAAQVFILTTRCATCRSPLLIEGKSVFSRLIMHVPERCGSCGQPVGFE